MAPRSGSAAAATLEGVRPEELMAIIRMLPDVLFRCERREDGRIYWTLNEGGLAEEFHLTTREIEGKPLEELFPGGASDAIKEHFEAAFRGERREFVNELGGRHFKHHPQPVYDAEGRVVAVVGFISEVTALVEAERELSRANRDLEAFAYTVSHDLRTPLSVIGLAAHLLESQADRLDDRGRAALGRIKSAAGRMDNLIVDVLHYARAGASEVVTETVDLAAVAREAVDALADRYPDHHVVIEVQDVPKAHGDPTLLGMVVENLMGNAWKFTRGSPSPRITFGATELETGPAWWVADNGPGFPAGSTEDLFQPFHQGGEERAGGLGVGLATVRRIVERHGGRAWAEETAGGGATVWFTLGDSS